MKMINAAEIVARLFKGTNRPVVHHFGIDWQKDFITGSLPVTGADADATRVAAFIRKVGKLIGMHHMTLDSHGRNHIANNTFWRDKMGNIPPALATVVTKEMVSDGTLRPWHSNMCLQDFGGKTLTEYCVWYLTELENRGRFPHTLWPEHCVIGRDGYNYHPEVDAAITEWEAKLHWAINPVTKGSNWLTEHFGGLAAEVELPWDSSTGLNTSFIQMLAQCDAIPITGQALSHCVRNTVQQVADNIGAAHVGKLVILRDCTSPVPAVPGIPALDFPAHAEAWLEEMAALGVIITTSDEFAEALLSAAA